MTVVHLTEPAIRRALAEARAANGRRELSDAAQRGLRLRITQTGTASWVLACRDKAGRMRRFPVGSFPALGVSAAREKARALHVAVHYSGADPIADRRRARSAAAKAREGINNLAALVDLYGGQVGEQLRSWAECKRSIARVFGQYGKLPVSELRLGDLQLAADRYPAKQQAAHAVRSLRPILKWAAAPGRSYIDRELTLIAIPVRPGERNRVLTRDELSRLLPVLKASARPHAAALRFMLLTLSRREEVCRAMWTNVDLAAGTWLIPAENAKNKQEHLVPLSRQAVAMLRERAPEKPAPDALVFATSTGRALSNWDKETKKLQVTSGTSGWNRHDLRRTGSTLLGKEGVMPPVLEAALNHKHIHSRLAAIYNQSRYRPKVGRALQRLADELDRIA